MYCRWLTLCCVCTLLVSAEVHFDAASIRLRPGTPATIGYRITGNPSGHTAIVTSSNPALVTASVTHDVDSGTVFLACNATANGGTPTITLKVTPLGGTQISDVLNCTIDAAPLLSSSTSATVGSEEASFVARIEFIDVITVPLGFSIGNSTPLSTALADDPNPNDNIFFVTITGPPNLNSDIATQPITLNCIVTDAFGPVSIDVPVTIKPVNDPPVLAYEALPSVRMDPANGQAVAVCAGLRLSDPIDQTVSVANTAKSEFLRWHATMQSPDGADTRATDLLSLCGDGSYRIDGSNIVVLPAGTVIATWSRPDARADRIAVRLTAAGTLSQLQDTARLLRFSHRQSPAVELFRSIEVGVDEPNVGSGTLPSNSCSIDCRVQAVNRPPVVTLQPLVVAPGKPGRLALSISDSDGLDKLTVTVVAPLPQAGTTLPASCRGDQAMSDGIVYTPTAADLSDDRITLQISDGVTEPVVVSTTISIHVQPDRMSIVSDPPLEVVWGHTLSWPVITVPTTTAVSLEDYGLPMPKVPVGLSYAAGELHFDWSQLPASGWLAWTTVATDTEGRLPTARRSASQRVLVRVRQPNVTDN